MRHFILIGMCLLVCGFAATDSSAEADIGVKGVGGRLAFVSPDNIDGTIGFGALIDLGTITPDIGLEATLDYWSQSEGSGNFEISFRDIAIGARAKYNFAVEDKKLKPYAAGGLAIHMLKSEIPAITFLGTTVGGGDVTDTEFGIDIAGGLGYAAGENIDIVGEVMYRIVSDFAQFVLSGGVIFWFGE